MTAKYLDNKFREKFYTRNYTSPLNGHRFNIVTVYIYEAIALWNRHQTVKANDSVLVFPPFGNWNSKPKELYDSIADVPTNGAFAGNETNGEPRPPASLQTGAASFVHRQRSFEFVLETLDGRNFRRTIPREAEILPWKRPIDRIKECSRTSEYSQLSSSFSSSQLFNLFY